MRIPCPFCGERQSNEFVYLGDANKPRPDLTADAPDSLFFEYVYIRSNLAGAHQELWYHLFGCHQWLRVKRDTRTHEILGVVYATGVGQP